MKLLILRGALRVSKDGRESCLVVHPAMQRIVR